MQFPDELRYASSHEWVRAEPDGTLTVGISDFAQDALGDVVYIELPEVGATHDAGDPMGEIESTKSVNEFYSPVAGSIVAVNDALVDAPETINSDPYGDGWIVKIAPAEGATLGDLQDATAYASSVEE